MTARAIATLAFRNPQTVVTRHKGLTQPFRSPQLLSRLSRRFTFCTFWQL